MKALQSPPVLTTRAAIADARKRARRWLELEEEPLLARIMAGDDDRLKFEVLKLVKAFGDGVPSRTLAVEFGESSFESIMLRAHEERIAEERKSSALTVAVIAPKSEPAPECSSGA